MPMSLFMLIELAFCEDQVTMHEKNELIQLHNTQLILIFLLYVWMKTCFKQKHTQYIHPINGCLLL